MSQPLDSLDVAPYDFFLFGHLTKEFQGMNFRSQKRMISAITTILSEIPILILSGVFDQWTER
jgi:hypothetical protein